MSTTLLKNTASQRIRVYAYTPADGKPKTGDAANLTCYISKDYGAVTALTDTSATEEDATNAPGYYWFDITQTESNADNIMVTAKSSTSGVYVLGAPAVIGTRPATGFLAPTVAGRTLDVSAGGEAGVDWANVGSPTTSLALTGTTIATTQKVDLETIKTQTVATTGAGTITVPAAATLASTTNITGGTITTVSGNVDGNVGGNVVGSVGSATTIGATGLDAIWEYAEASIGAGIGARLKTGIPNVAPGVNGGLPTVDANNYIAGIAGTLNQLDDLNNISTAQVNAEMVDVIATDVAAELAAIPAANASLKAKITFLAMLARNKLTQTATTGTLFADDGSTSVGTTTVSDDATTYTRGEWV